MTIFISKKILFFLFLLVIGISIYFFLPKIKTNNNQEYEKFGKVEERFLENNSNNKYFNYFPVRLEDFYYPPKMYGLWPYGVKGNDKYSHSEGHPGWDFELIKGSKVYALSDLYIAQIHDGDKFVDGKPLKVIEAYTMLGNERYHIVYHSVNNLEPEVVEGATILGGKPLAEAGYPLSENTVMIHFGVFQPRDSVGSCPTPYFSEELQPLIKEMVSKSLDVNTQKPFESACVGKINKKLYMENYPESVKYLEGNEPFE